MNAFHGTKKLPKKAEIFNGWKVLATSQIILQYLSSIIIMNQNFIAQGQYYRLSLVSGNNYSYIFI